MKKILFISILTLLLSGCGVGLYSVQSGLEDASYVLFANERVEKIVVEVDGTTYQVETVKEKAYKSNRDYKQTDENTLKLLPGEHHISVLLNGETVYDHKVFLSPNETKIIVL